MTGIDSMPYGYRPSASYFGTNVLPPPIYPAYQGEAFQNYPLRFQITNENTMWFVGGLAAAFLFSKFIKGGMIGKVGYYGSLAAAGLAVTDFVGILPISTVKSLIPSF